MKYRHAHHAGNFADVHKHVTLLALLAALARKEKGFFYLDTHAGRGVYAAGSEAKLGIERLAAASPGTEELQRYTSAVSSFRRGRNNPHAYPGSPLLAAHSLRPQDRATFVELEPAECRTLELASSPFANVRVECGDGYERLRAHLPPRERRGLLFIDPPYEDPRDFAKVESAIAEAQRRFATGVIAAWYPIKSDRDLAAWQSHVTSSLTTPLLLSELWLYPRDSRVSLNGSGLLIFNPPYQLYERMTAWLPELHAALDVDETGGHKCALFAVV